MCGITGIYDRAGKGRVDLPLLERMTTTLTYRGPDDQGFYLERDVGLGFRRLAIIDLTTGNQPIANEDGTVLVVCNGEIYNFKELRRDLEARGHQFRTNCDVEVLVHLYEDQGTGFLPQLNGQFAFAVFDTRRRCLLLARDHVGIAPLFYTQIDQMFLFASEIKALLKHPLVNREIDLVGLDQILTFPGLVSPRTMFKGIHSLGAGHSILVTPEHLEVKPYWELTYPEIDAINPTRPLADYIEQLDEVLTQSLRYRLYADVPVGFYLSGGLDSSLMAALIHKVSPQESRHSFSIGFTRPEIDERLHQQAMAWQIGSTHHEIVFDWQQISARLQKAIYHAESPLKESYNTCSLALSEFVHQSSMKVILTGEGADELFGGYLGYRFDPQRQAMLADAFDLETLLEQEVRQTLWGDPFFFYEKDYYRFREVKTALYSAAVREALPEFDCTNHALINVDRVRNRHPMHKRSYVDFHLRLSDHLLADHGDRVAYANSVEARYPFLDVRVIELAAAIPPQWMVQDGIEKFPLRQLAARYVPEHIVKRPKFGFVAPGSPDLLKQQIAWVDELLSYEYIKRCGYFNPETTQRLKTQYQAEHFTVNTTFDTDLLMVVLTFGIFKETFDLPDFC